MSDFRICARPQAFGQFLADLYPIRRQGGQQRLRIRIDRNKFHSLNGRGNHPVYRIISSSAHSDNLDGGELIRIDFELQSRHLHSPSHCVGFSFTFYYSTRTLLFLPGEKRFFTALFSLFQEVAPNNRQILKDPETKSQRGHIIEIDSQAVADENQ